MKIFITLALLVSAVMSQDVLEVTCGQDAITAKFEKKVAETANYQMDDLHFADPTCHFDEDDGDYYVKRIDPLQSCGTIFTANATHVSYFNSISSGAVESGLSYPHGIIVGQPTNTQLISVSLTCTYKIDLRVSAAFLPNISYVFIEIPDVFEYGVFKVAMAIYRTAAYREPYGGGDLAVPELQPDETVFVGVSMIGDTSPDVFLLIKKCWATVFEDAESDPYYDLIDGSCPLDGAIEGTVRVTQNGIGHQALWQTEVFKFVGSEEEYNTVWLHCDVTLCMQQCEPECAARRKRRSAEENVETKTISIGPFHKLDISLYQGENGVETIVIMNSTNTENDKVEGGMNNSLLIIIGALAAFCLLCLSMALIIVLMRLKRANHGHDSVTTTGTINKGFSI